MSRNSKRVTGAAAPPVNNPTAQAPQDTATRTSAIETVPLPSKGQFYPPGHPLSDAETVEIKYMTAKEEDILTDRALLKKGVAVDRMLQNIIVNKDIKVDSLLIGDKNAILVKARTTGYGAEYETKVTCPACYQTGQHVFDLDKLGHNDFISALEEEEVDLEKVIADKQAEKTAR